MASGDTLDWFIPGLERMPWKTNPATFETNAQNMALMAFADDTDESILIPRVMPGQYDGSDISVVLGWRFAAYVGSQTCDWEVSFMRVHDDGQSIDSLSFATAKTGIFTEADATGELDYATLDFTQAEADSVAGGEHYWLKITRDASGGTQGSPGDVHLAFVHIKYK